MKVPQRNRLFPEIQSKFVYLPAMLICCISPFAMNVLFAAFFLVLFDAAERAILMHYIADNGKHLYS